MLILFFITFMLVYVSTGGATVSALSIVAHAIGFVLANSTLAIAIILNIMAYYTIFCCIIDLVRHIKDEVEKAKIEDERKMIEAIPDDKEFKLGDDYQFEDIPDDPDHRDLAKDLIEDKEEMGLRKSKKRGDDEITEENNDEDIPNDPFNFDEKEFQVRSSMINKKKTSTSNQEEDLPNMKHSQNKRRHKKESPAY